MSDDYLAVVRTCNVVIHNLGKNLWSKYFPEESADNGKLNLKFDIEPTDSTPGRILVCLAKQVHNFKCVAKILDRIKEAELKLQSLAAVDEEKEKLDGVGDNLAQLSSICSQLTVLAKCEAAMRRRHSVRHRVVSAGSGKVACYALCDIECPLLKIRLSQLECYTLLDNSNPQSWLVQETKSGQKQRVPPVFLAVEAETAELQRIARVRKGLAELAEGSVAILAAQLIGVVRKLRVDGQVEMQRVLLSSDLYKSFLYRTQMLERSLKILASIEDCSEGTKLTMVPGEFRVLLDTIDILTEKFKLALTSSSTSIAGDVINLQKGLGVIRSYAHAQDVYERASRSGGGGGGGSIGGGGGLGSSSSRRSFRSSRSHQLKSAHARTSVFEFTFEFIESTNKHSTITTRPLISNRYSSETVTRQRQEVARKFVIQSVWDGRKEVSLQDAISAGVVDFNRGIYIELLGNRKEMPMEAAMAAGKIRVEMVTEQQVSEDNSSFGIINVEEIRLTEDGQPTGVTSTVSYVVHAVVDVANKNRVNFQEAALLGLIDRETGAFTNTATGEVLPLTEAISKGFLKAYVSNEPNSLEVDPDNRPTAQNIGRLKTRWNAISGLAKGLKSLGKDA